MGEIIVIYHSQQFGNTKVLAEALAEGVREAGAEVNLINTNERRVTLEEFLAADAVAIGTPDYFSYVAGTIKTFFDDIYLWDQSGESVKGKAAVLFCSHGGGGGKVRIHAPPRARDPGTRSTSRDDVPPQRDNVSGRIPGRPAAGAARVLEPGFPGRPGRSASSRTRWQAGFVRGVRDGLATRHPRNCGTWG